MNYLASSALTSMLQQGLRLILFLSLLTGIPTHKCLGQTALKSFSAHHYLPFYKLRKMGDPTLFQGNQKHRNYFEGWYFKMVSEDQSSILSVIPGISLSADKKEQHAFIQLIDGRTAETWYYTYPIDSFSFSGRYFAVRIGPNYFSADSLVLDLSSDSSSFRGKVFMHQQVSFPGHGILNSGIMGWYRFVPFMQCYHGVVNLTNQLSGELTKNGLSNSFNKGKGYIEKDWGSSMPSAWIWMQSNHFTQDNTSLMLSVANVPWLGKSFTGFLGFLWHDSTLYRFATYTHAKLLLSEAGNDQVKLTLKERKFSLEIKAARMQSGLLKAPVNGAMDRRIPESIDARIYLTVRDRKNQIQYSDSSSLAGFEMVGDIKTLCRKPRR